MLKGRGRVRSGQWHFGDTCLVPVCSVFRGGKTTSTMGALSQGAEDAEGPSRDRKPEEGLNQKSYRKRSLSGIGQRKGRGNDSLTESLDKPIDTQHCI